MASSIISFAPKHDPETEDNARLRSFQQMSLRVVRGPLEARKSEAVLRHYNRLASVDIPLAEFLRWVQDGTEGPAWHVLLENDAAEVVGHSSVIPFRCRFGERQILAGKSEYSFILEEYRSAKIRGFENSAKPRNAIMVNELFKRCHAEGLGPLLISTSSARQRSLGLVGCGAVSFLVTECLLVLRPWRAAKATPNLHGWQRALLGGTGTVQAVARLLAEVVWRAPREIRSVSIGEGISPRKDGPLCFFEDQAALKWRYPEGQYEQLCLDGKAGEYVILKAGARKRYLRVCQWRLGHEQPSPPLIAKLLEVAKRQGALGVRWAVYGEDDAARNLVGRLKRFGFLGVRRMRTLLVSSNERELLSPDKWDLTDSLFSFDP